MRSIYELNCFNYQYVCSYISCRSREELAIFLTLRRLFFTHLFVEFVVWVLCASVHAERSYRTETSISAIISPESGLIIACENSSFRFVFVTLIAEERLKAKVNSSSLLHVSRPDYTPTPPYPDPPPRSHSAKDYPASRMLRLHERW